MSGDSHQQVSVHSNTTHQFGSNVTGANSPIKTVINQVIGESPGWIDTSLKRKYNC